jgi:cellulose synthase/poly-beta-1,6-N-acetylglucosamine synthase-like glycosyltransferase
MEVVIFWTALALVLYILVGWPLLLRAMAQARRRPIALSDTHQPPITVIIAVHNGEPFLAAKLNSFLENGYPVEKIQIIVASDASTDGTDAIARQFSARNVELLELPRGGKCAALSAAFPHARGEILILTDVRQTIVPGSLQALVRNFADPQVGTVSCHLRIRQGDTLEEADLGLYRRFDDWIRDSLAAIDSMFGAAGAFYAIRRSLAEPIPDDTLLDDMYLPLTAFRKGYRCIIEPKAIAWDIPTPLDVERGRKLRTMAGNYQLWIRCPWLFTPANRMWFHFLSYKVGRLVLPELLFAIAVSSFFLSNPLRLVAVMGQTVFYGLALLDPAVPQGFPLKRVSSLARTFVTMMVAAIQGLKVLFVPARSLWKVTSAAK